MNRRITNILKINLSLGNIFNMLAIIEDRKDMQDPEDVQHDLEDLKADLKELRGYRHGGPVRRSRTTNQFRGWGKARKPKHKMR